MQRVDNIIHGNSSPPHNAKSCHKLAMLLFKMLLPDNKLHVAQDKQFISKRAEEIYGVELFVPSFLLRQVTS